MKNLLILLSFFFLAAGCEAEDIELSVDRTMIEFTAKGGEQELTATASEPLELVPGDSWVTAAEGARDGNATKINVTAERNTTGKDRSTKLTVTAGDQRKSIIISQSATGGDSGDIVIPEGALASNLPEILGMGWNLGNQFDAYNQGVAGETAWGNPRATQETFAKVKAAGFKTVRIPVTWLGKVGDAPEYKIDEAWLDRLAQVVGYAENAGLMTIINIHHDGSESNWWLDIVEASKDAAVHKQIMEQITAMWTQIAQKFADKGTFLIFEGFNEIHDGKWGWGTNRTDGGKQYKCLNEWNQAFVDAVRATGGNNADRILGVPAYCTSVDLAVSSFVMPKDSAKDRLMLSVHCYDPSDYTLTAKYSEWGHTAAASKKPSGNNENDLKKVFEKIRDKFISKGVPVYMGEFGCVNRETAREQAFQQYYFRYYAKLAKTYGVASIVWDNGAKGAGNEKHAFIDHATGEYCSPEAKAAMEALLESYDDNLTLEEVYNNAPK